MTRQLVAFVLIAISFSAPRLGARRKDRSRRYDLWAMKRLGAPALSPDGTRGGVHRAGVVGRQEQEHDEPVAGGPGWRRAAAADHGGRPLTRRRPGAPTAGGSPLSRSAATTKPARCTSFRSTAAKPRKSSRCRSRWRRPSGCPAGRTSWSAPAVIPELAGTLSKKDIAAMKKEAKRRKDSKMTAKVTENRLYRYFDHYLTDKLASRLLRVDVASKEAIDLTPGFDRLFGVDGELRYEVSPDGSQVAVVINSTPPPFRDDPNSRHLPGADQRLGPVEEPDRRQQGRRRQPTFAPRRPLAGLSAPRESTYYNGEFARLWRLDLASGKSTPLSAAARLFVRRSEVLARRPDAVAVGRGQGRAADFQNERRRHGLHGRLSRRNLQPPAKRAQAGSCFSTPTPTGPTSCSPSTRPAAR